MVRACLQKAEDAQTHTRRQQALSALQPVMCIYPPAAAGSSQCGMASTATKPTRQPTTTTTPPQVKDPTFSQDKGKPLLFSFTSICRKKKQHAILVRASYYLHLQKKKDIIDHDTSCKENNFAKRQLSFLPWFFFYRILVLVVSSSSSSMLLQYSSAPYVTAVYYCRCDF